MASTLTNYLKSKIEEEVRIIEADLATGKAHDYAEYKFLCGKHRGLLVVSSLLIELEDRMREDDDVE